MSRRARPRIRHRASGEAAPLRALPWTLWTLLVLAPGISADTPLPTSIGLEPRIDIATGIEAPRSVAMLDDGVVVGGQGGVASYEFDGNQRWRTPETISYVQDFAVSPDQSSVLLWSFRDLWSVDADTGAVRWQLKLISRSLADARDTIRPGEPLVYGMPDGDPRATSIVDAAIHREAPGVGWIAARGGVIAVDLLDGTILDAFTPDFPVERFALRHNDNGAVLLVGDGANQVLHLAPSDETSQLVRPGQLPERMDAYRMTPDASRILVGGKRWGYLINTRERTSRPLVNVSGYEITRAGFARSAPRMLFSGLDNMIDVLDLESATLAGGLGGHRASLREVLVSDDGARAVSIAEDRVPRVWDVPRSVEIGHLLGQAIAPVDLAWDLEAGRVGTVDPSGTLRLWDLAELVAPHLEDATARPTLTVQRGHTGTASQVAVAPDGTLVASAKGREIVLWDRASGRALRRMMLPSWTQVSGLHFTSRARLVSVELNGVARIWDTATGAEVQRIRVGSSAQIVTPVHDTSLILLAHTFDPFVTVLDAGQRRVSARVMLEPDARSFGYVTALGATPDGAVVAVGGSDGRIVEYDTASGQRLRQIDGAGNARITRLTYSSDGRRLAAATYEQVTIYQDGAYVDDEWVGGTLYLSFLDHDTLLSVGRGGFDSPVEVIELGADGSVERVRDRGVLRAGAVALVSPGEFVATTSDGALMYQRLSDDSPHERLPNLIAGIDDLAFSADGTELVVATQARLDVWSLAIGRPDEPRVERVVYPYNTHASIAANQDALVILDTATLRVLGRNPVSATQTVEHGLETGSFYGTAPIPLPGTGEVLLVTDTAVLRIDVATGTHRASYELPEQPGENEFSRRIRGVALAPDGTRIIIITASRRALVFDLASGEIIDRLKSDQRCTSTNADGSMNWELPEDGFCHMPELLAFAPDGNELALVLDATGSAELLFVDLVSGAIRARIETGESGHRAIALSPDGRLVALSGDSNAIQLRDLATGALQANLVGHGNRVSRLAFSPDGKLLASGGQEGVVRVWRIDSQREVAKLFSTDDGHWAVTAADGRYDAADPGSTAGLFWVLADEPYRGLPIELFFKDYYEPRLLPRLLSGEVFPAVTPLDTLNRDQPQVRIATVSTDDANPERLAVDIEVRYETEATQGQVDALKLFRDGQLVAQLAAPEIGVAAGGATTMRIPGLQQPMGAEPLTFSAYAFNEDGIKSRTANRTHERAPAPPRPRRAFVISVGVNRYQNPAWNLFYAGNDARVSNRMLRARLEGEGFDEVVPVLLSADLRATETTATRAHLEAVLKVLGGQAAETALLAEIPGADRLSQATPDDTLVFTFSGHGYADQGRFHFFLHDIGPGAQRVVDEGILARALNSDRFSELMLEIDAGSQVMVIDACNSAASVNAAGFRPGPMGSRGLGQMAYDKGMLVLASSQAEAVAIESAQLRHGIMSYALLKEGLEGNEADFDPADGVIGLGEWARWGVRRVPEIYTQIFDGTFEGSDRGVARLGIAARGDGEDYDDDDDWDDWDEEEPPPQQPSLFDFRGGARGDLSLSANVGAGEE